MRIGAISLGCDKNRVDTEKMLDRLVCAGHELVGSEEEADIIIINTCAFIESAKEESLEEIFAALSYKPRGKKVIVTGCLSERYFEELQEEAPEIDAILGVRDYDCILRAVENVSRGEKFAIKEGNDSYHDGRVITTPYHYAYLRIADGCNNKCTYCAIPSIRGGYVSEKPEKLIAEAKALADDGVKELILVAQDVTRYGTDWDGKPHLIELLKELEKLDFVWIRLLYLEPEMVDGELLDYIAASKKVVKYADIPFQHVADGVLKRMNRRTKKQDILRVIDLLKERGIAVRSSFICGFPGESEEEHLEIIRFIREAEIDFAGFFAYSREENTPADRLKGHLPKREIERRTDALKAVQAEIVREKNIARIGTRVCVVCDGIDYDRQLFEGRAEFQTPDIDTKIYFSSEVSVDAGNFYTVEITDVDGLDLVGKAVDE